MTSQERDYINNNKHYHTFVIAQPYCHLDMLLALSSITGYTGIIGQQPIHFYESLINIHNGIDPDAVYGHPPKLFEDGISLVKYNNDCVNHYARIRNHHIKHMLIPNRGPCKMIGMENIGFGNDILVDFVNMARSIFEDSNTDPLQIVFLMGDISNMLDKHKELNPKDNCDKFLDYILSQRDQISEACELGDVVITGNFIKENPFEALLKCEPYHYPDKDKVMKIAGMFK